MGCGRQAYFETCAHSRSISRVTSAEISETLPQFRPKASAPPFSLVPVMLRISRNGIPFT